jgi:hypothetical protein
MTDSKTLYDQDFVAWTEQQADALRSAARGSTNQPLHRGSDPRRLVSARSEPVK